MFSKTTLALSALAYATQVSAHGHIQGITVNGQYNTGPIPSLSYENPAPVIAGWLADNQDNGFVEPNSFGNADIICHKSAKNAQGSIKVAAGDEIQLHWNTWPESHHGPVIDYLASCNGDCTTVDKETLKFSKIKEGGLIDATKGGQTGYWASDELIANNNTWVTSIPTSIAPGSYVLRHEIIALHSAGDANGAQAYPQCINFEVTGSGTNDLADGTLATEFYTPTDAGIKVSIYPPSGYTIPGPELLAGSDSETPSTGNSTTPAVSASASGAASASAPAATAPAASASSAAAEASTPAAGVTSAPAAGNTAVGSTPTTLVTKAYSATAPATPVETGASEEVPSDDDEDSTCI